MVPTDLPPIFEGPYVPETPGTPLPEPPASAPLPEAEPEPQTHTLNVDDAVEITVTTGG
jgi:hypothetical protein